MSWLSIPLPNPFKSLQISNNDDDNDEEEDEIEGPQKNMGSSAIGESIGRQFRALISPETSNSGDGGSPSSRTFEGIRSDLEEFKGTFKSSLSIFSSNNAVSEISKLASNFLQFNEESDVDHVNNSRRIDVNHVNDDVDDDGGDDDDDDDDDGVGINDGVVEFAQQISNRPELWTEFPLSLDHEFDMSEAQYQHSLIIQQLVPSIADLRSNICSVKTENQFWMIYFILLLPRLDEEDSELLSTPEIVKARETLLKMLQAKKSEINTENPQSDSSYDSDNEFHKTQMSKSKVMTSENSSASQSNDPNNNNNKLLQSDNGKENQPDAKPENLKESLERGSVDNLEEAEENSATRGTSAAPKQFQSEDDVSFSDLEDDDSDVPKRQSSSGPSQVTRTSSPEGSNDWVQLNKNVGGGNKVKSQSSLRERDSEGEDSTGWLTVDDYDP